MEITRNMLFYWIKKRWSHAINSETKISKKAKVSRPMFWSSVQEMRGHLVVVDTERMKQIDRFYPETIFLCIGASDPSICRTESEWVMLPDEDRIDRVFNIISTIFDKFYEWERLLDQASNEFLSYEAIVRSCESITEDPMALLDSSFNYVTYSKRLSMELGYEDMFVDESNRLPLETVNLLIALGDLDALEKREGVWLYTANDPMLNINIFYEKRMVGRIGMPYTKDPVRNAYNADVLEVVGEEVERLYEKLGTFFRQPAASAKFRYLLVDLLEGRPVPRETVMMQMEQMGYDEGDVYCLVQVRPQSMETTRRYITVLLSHLETVVPQSTCFSTDSKCFLLINRTKNDLTTSARFTNDINMFLRESYMLAGASRDFDDIFDVALAAKQTDIALTYGRNVNPMYWYLEYDSYAFRYALGCICHELPPRLVCSPAIGVLAEHDSKNGTNLNETLRTYVELRYNAVEAANRLFVSRSTFLRRLERIKKLTGLNLDSLDERLYLGLSYRILDSDMIVG